MVASHPPAAAAADGSEADDLEVTPRYREVRQAAEADLGACGRRAAEVAAASWYCWAGKGVAAGYSG